MEHLRNIESIHLNASALTIGSFDGLHLGHQALIKHLVRSAQEIQIPSVVLSFYPHPSVVLHGRRPSFYIMPPDEKATRLSDMGVDYVITQEFTQTLSLMKASDYLKWLKDQLQFQILCVGENFALGHKREGDINYLREVSQEFYFKLQVIPPVFMDGEIISSTRVREALRSGDIARVATYLGQPFALRGKVVPGSGRGKKMDIPTANLEIWSEMAYPRKGVYACIANVNGGSYQSVVNIGVRPTFDDDLDAPVVEAHLLNFSSDIYGKEIELSFIQRLRDEQRFNNVEELIVQIQHDIESAKKIFKSSSY